MKKIVIIGGSGFIGSNLTKTLVAKGYSVIVIDAFTSQIHGKDYRKSVLYQSLCNICTIVRADVRKSAKWREYLEGAFAIVHLAAETGTGQSMYQISRYTDVNIEGTSSLLEALGRTKNKPERIVVASSRAIYGEGKYYCDEHGFQFPSSRGEADMAMGVFDPLCSACGKTMHPMSTDENSRIQPTSIYGITKQVQEQMVLLYGKMTGMSAIALRYQNVYGPGQSLKNPYTGILSIFSTAMLHDNQIEIFEDGEESRDFVYIDDIVKATILAIEKVETSNYAVNVGSGIPVSVLKVAETLKRLYGSKSDIHVGGKYRIGDIRHNFADLLLARNTLGYTPSMTFDDGVKIFAHWVMSQDVYPDKYENSMAELKQKGLLK